MRERLTLVYWARLIRVTVPGLGPDKQTLRICAWAHDIVRIPRGSGFGSLTTKHYLTRCSPIRSPLRGSSSSSGYDGFRAKRHKRFRDTPVREQASQLECRPPAACVSASSRHLLAKSRLVPAYRIQVWLRDCHSHLPNAAFPQYSM